MPSENNKNNTEPATDKSGRTILYFEDYGAELDARQFNTKRKAHNIKKEEVKEKINSLYDIDSKMSLSNMQEVLFKEIVRSLREEATAWKFCEHHATHRGGLSIWIANGTFGIEVESPTKVRFIEEQRKIIREAIIAAKGVSDYSSILNELS